jgi:hypothetical protein
MEVLCGLMSRLIVAAEGLSVSISLASDYKSMKHAAAQKRKVLVRYNISESASHFDEWPEVSHLKHRISTEQRCPC